jgi:hypothetical protein
MSDKQYHCDFCGISYADAVTSHRISATIIYPVMKRVYSSKSPLDLGKLACWSCHARFSLSEALKKGANYARV